MVITQLCNGHFPSDRSEGRSAARHGAIKLGFAAEGRFLGRICLIKAALAHPAEVCCPVVPVSVFSLCSANWGCGGHSCSDGFA